MGTAAGDTSLVPEAPMAAPPQPALPREFGRYRLLRVLGAGAMGTVYLAHDSQLERQVALKIPHLGDRHDATRLERFYREARLAATLSHPSICPIFDIGSHAGTPFISMAFVQGKPLSSALKAGKPLAGKSAASIVRKLALALDEAHRRGVIHRDLKPANVMIDQRGEPIVMDFGLARQSGASDQAQLTQSGAILGTPAYMAPEQVRGDNSAVGSAADQYALGVILYQMLAGRLPFEGSVMSVLAQIATQSPEPPSSHCPQLNPELEAICLRAMARDPQDRFASAGELAAALAAFLRQPRDAHPEPHAAGESLAATRLGQPAPGVEVADMRPPEAHRSRRAAPATDRPHDARFRVLLSTRRGRVAGALGGITVVLAAGFLMRDFTVGSGQRDGAMPGAATAPAAAAPPADGLADASPGTSDTEANAPADDLPEPDARALAQLNAEEPLNPDAEEEPAAVPDSVDTPTIDGAPADDAGELNADEPPAEEATDDAPEGGESSSAKPRGSKRAPVDPFPAGTRWMGNTRQWYRGEKGPRDGDITLVVLARDRGTARIRYSGSKGGPVAEVAARIRGNRIEWNTADAEVTGGAIGRYGVVGQVTGSNRIELKYSGRSAAGQPMIGVATLNLQR